MKVPALPIDDAGLIVRGFRDVGAGHEVLVLTHTLALEEEGDIRGARVSHITK